MKEIIRHQDDLKRGINYIGVSGAMEFRETPEETVAREVMEDTNLLVTIAHDYQCPWCWVGFLHAKRLKEAFPQLVFEWVSYELLPDFHGTEQRPGISDRLRALAAADGVFPGPLPNIVSTHAALAGAEFVKAHAATVFDTYNEAIYRAFYQDRQDISDLDILGRISQRIGVDADKFIQTVEAGTYDSKIIRFTKDAYATGITHVPTFRFGGEQCAEASYQTITEMILRHID